MAGWPGSDHAPTCAAARSNATPLRRHTASRGCQAACHSHQAWRACITNSAAQRSAPPPGCGSLQSRHPARTPDAACPEPSPPPAARSAGSCTGTSRRSGLRGVQTNAHGERVVLDSPGGRAITCSHAATPAHKASAPQRAVIPNHTGQSYSCRLRCSRCAPVPSTLRQEGGAAGGGRWVDAQAGAGAGAAAQHLGSSAARTSCRPWLPTSMHIALCDCLAAAALLKHQPAAHKQRCTHERQQSAVELAAAAAAQAQPGSPAPPPAPHEAVLAVRVAYVPLPAAQLLRRRQAFSGLQNGAWAARAGLGALISRCKPVGTRRRHGCRARRGAASS